MGFTTPQRRRKCEICGDLFMIPLYPNAGTPRPEHHHWEAYMPGSFSCPACKKAGRKPAAKTASRSRFGKILDDLIARL